MRGSERTEKRPFVRHSFFSVFCLALMIMLTACLPTRQQPSSPESEAKGPIELTVWTYYNGEQLSSFETMVKEFNEGEGLAAGILLHSRNQGSIGELQSLVEEAADQRVGAEDLPDIFSAYPDTAYSMDQRGLLADLSPYLTAEEWGLYKDSYVEEGRFDGTDAVKIFPIAKSTEILMVNATDFAPFAQDTGLSYEDLSTVEGLTRVAEAYYVWTDKKTEEANDGKAFFGRDSLANYLLLGADQLGGAILTREGGAYLDREVARRLWDNYYIPFIKGYFAASGKFRSDDVRTGNVLAYVGSTASATYFPDKVTLSDSREYPIDLVVLEAPSFEGGKSEAVQQGAGMAVVKGEEERVRAAVFFLKWFTEKERNILFCGNSGYLPVGKTSGDIKDMKIFFPSMEEKLEAVLGTALRAVDRSDLYIQPVFEGAREIRNLLQTDWVNRAEEDRALVRSRLEAGQTMEEATKDLVSEEYFNRFYEELVRKMEELLA